MATSINPDEAQDPAAPPPIILGAGGPPGGLGNAEIDQVTGLLIQNPVGELPAGEALEADYILVRRIELRDGVEGPFAFAAPGQAILNAPERLETTIAELRNDVYQPVLPPKAPLPGDGPLDVHCDETTTIVFALVDPGDGRKFRFSQSSRAISLGGIPDGDRQNYFNLRHVAEDGTETAAHHSGKDCRIAYFTARRTADPFRHSFNIHVEIVYPNGYDMPIIIDPDVRYPGGSG